MLVFAALMAVGIASCEKERGDDNGGGNNNGGDNNGGPTTLVGTIWQDSSGFITFSFTDDTSFTMSTAGMNVNGTYTYDANTSTGTMIIPGINSYTFSIRGNTMSVTYEDGETAFDLIHLSGDQVGTEMSNTTWAKVDNVTGHTYLLIFNTSNGVIYAHTWHSDDGSGNVEDGDQNYMGNYTYQGEHGTLTLLNSDSENGGPATLTGSFRVAGNQLSLQLDDGTDVVLTKFYIPGK